MKPDPTSLDRLHDIIAPPPVPWWPPAPGWHWLIGVVLIALLFLLVRGLIHWQRNRYRREALAEWRQLVAGLANDSTRYAALAGLAILIKRAAVSAFPRTEVAGLTGIAWLEFLDRTGSMNGFRSDIGKRLEGAAYGAEARSSITESQGRESAQLVRNWLIRHRVKKAKGGRG